MIALLNLFLHKERGMIALCCWDQCYTWQEAQ